jgi:hypothetical protein
METKTNNNLSENSKVIKFIEEVKEAFIKAIGTSSSIDQERDERSVENYVRGNTNTNVNAEPSDYTIGGNLMSNNTTEPDPQGDIAVTKVIDQMTRPEGDVSVSDAPNNPAIVPDQATIPSSATSAVAPTSEEMAEPVEKAATCKECGQTLPVAKLDEIAKAETCADCGKPGDQCNCVDKAVDAKACADCGKPMNLCNCMGKAVDAEESAKHEAEETSAKEAKEEMKKSIGSPIWQGSFLPIN